MFPIFLRLFNSRTPMVAGTALWEVLKNMAGEGFCKLTYSQKRDCSCLALNKPIRSL